MADAQGDPDLGAPPPEGPRHDWTAPARIVAFVLLAALVIAAASLLPFAGVGLVLLAPIFRRVGSTLGPGRAGLVLPLAMVASAPTLLLMPLLMMTNPVVASTWRCGTAMLSTLFVLPVMVFVAGATAVSGALILVAFTPRLLRALAPWCRAALLLLSGALVVAGAVRLLRFPQPEDWTSSLRTAAISSVLDAGQLGTCQETCNLPPLAFQASGQERTLLVDCESNQCAMRLGDARGAPLGSRSMRNSSTTLGAPVEVRVDDALGVAVVLQRGRSIVAFDIATGIVRDVSLGDVAREVAPSPFAVLAMLFAVGVAIQRTRRATGERAAVARLHEGSDARVDDAGVVHPDDGGPSFRPAGATLAEGPGVILARPASGAYRSGGDRDTWVLAGPRASHIEAHLQRATVFDWEAVAVLCLAGAPLFAAALRGLLL